MEQTNFYIELSKRLKKITNAGNDLVLKLQQQRKDFSEYNKTILKAGKKLNYKIKNF